jgi:prepilin-type processing-associated H-X9-DG protein
LNNLREIGLAVHSTFDAHGLLPYARECPAPWRNGQDIHCQTLPMANTYTGPSERWWAPYDNRPGTLPTRALPGFSPDSFLWDFVGRERKLFVCPEGIDRTPGSPTYDQAFQVSYALNPAVGGMRLGDNRLPSVLAWEHDDLPVCPLLSATTHWADWPVSPDQQQLRHAPMRHMGTGNVLYKDGSVSARRNGA